MERSQIKNLVEAALLGAGRPLSLDQLMSLFTTRAADAADRSTVREVLNELASDYADRGIELKEVGSGFRVQIRSSMSGWLTPLWEERPPRYSRALLETLALIAYRQPITRGEIEAVRGVAVSTQIVRTLLERGWVRVVGHRDVPGRPAMFATTKAFLDYFSLKRLEDLPPLAQIKELDGLNVELELPQPNPQTDLLDAVSEADTGGLTDRTGAETVRGDEGGVVPLSRPEAG